MEKEHITDRKWESQFYWDFKGSNEVCNTAYALYRTHELSKIPQQVQWPQKK